MRLIALICLVMALGAGGRAAAHAQLVAAEPAAGAVVAAMPSEVVLRFNEPVAALSVRWFPPAGAPIDVAPRIDGDALRVPVPAGLGVGTHTLSWRVVSADGHPLGASHAFSLGAPSAAAGAMPGPVAAARGAAMARGLLTLTLVLGAGGAVYARLVEREGAGSGARGLAVAAALATPVAAVLALGMHGLDLLGEPLDALAGRAPWAAASASRVAATAGVGAAAGLVAAAALRRAGAAGAMLAGAAWALAAASFALSGHAATARPTWLTAPSVALHAAAFLFWLGALPGIMAGARGAGPGFAATLRRFSAMATPLVAALVLTGAALAAVQLGRPGAIVDTAYGRLLAAKLAAVLALLVLAAFNRVRLTPAIAAGAPGAARRLRHSVAMEIVLGLVILALASGFRLTPPPRALDAADPALQLQLHGRSAGAHVVLRPGRPGPNTVEIGLGGLAPREVTVVLRNPAAGVEPIVVAAVPRGGGWATGPVQLPEAGRWSLTLDLLIGDFEKQTLSGEVTLPR